LIKIGGKNNFKGFVRLGEFIKSLVGNYTYGIEKIYSRKETLKALQEDEENLTIVDKKEYSKFRNLVILEGLEN
jgi:hypothetical protein